MKLISILLFAALPALAGEIQLYNGKNLSGWTFYSAGKGTTAEKSPWIPKDGVLTCSGEPVGFIRTEASYENYTLSFEWRWSGEKAGNSGLLLHAGEVAEGKAWPTSIEAQLESGNAGDFWSIGSKIEATGKNTGIRWQRTANPREKPIGEWNTMSVTCTGDSISVTVNDTLVNEGKNASVTKGAIGFQSEGSPIEFRKIVLQQK